jgi:hypothetical protein
MKTPDLFFSKSDPARTRHWGTLFICTIITGDDLGVELEDGPGPDLC